MSNQEKVITFTFKVDEQTLGRLKNEIRDITNAMQKLVQVASGIGTGGRGGPVAVGGGGSFSNQGSNAAIKAQGQQGQSGGLASAFVEAGKSMKDMANISKDALRVMSDGVRRAIDEQKSSLRGLDADIKKIIDDYDKLAKAKDTLSPEPGNVLANQYQGMMNQQMGKLLGAQQQRNAAGGQLSTLQNQQAQMQGALNPPPPGAPGGGGGGVGGFMAGVPGFLPRNSSGGISKWAAAAAIMGVANFGLDEHLAGNRFEATAGQRRASLVAGQMNALRGGDYRMSYAARTLDSEAQAQLAAQTSGFGANAEQVRSGVGQVVGSVPVIGALARKVGVVGEDSGGGAFGGFTTATQQSNMAENALAQIKARADAQVLEGMAMQKFQGNLGSRVQIQRMLGIGGLGTTRTRPARSGRGTVTEKADPYADLEYRLSRQGYDMGEYASAVAGLRQGAGAQFGGMYGGEAMAAASTGMGGYAELLGAGGRAGGGGQFARMAIGGGIDRYAGIGLGQAVIGQGFDVTGTTTGMGLLGAAQLGMGFKGDVGDFQRVGQVGAGIGLGNTVLGGSLDPYQKGYNLVSAMGIKPGGDVYSQDYLANGMNMRQMADAVRTGQLTQTAQAYGITRGDIRKQFGASISSVLQARTPGMGDTAAGAHLKAFQESGKDLPEYLNGLTGVAKIDAIRKLGSVYGDITGQGEEAGMGLLGTAAGLDSKQQARLGLVGKKVTGVEAEDLQARAEKEKKVNDELLRIHEKFAEVIKGSSDDFTKFKNFGENMSAEADRFIKALARMTDSIEKKFPTIVGEPPARSTAPNPSRREPGGNKI